MKTAHTISRMYGTREVMESLIDYIHGDVLDFGAGSGKQKRIILTKATSYTALDIEPAPGVDIVGDVLDPPIADGTYDAIVSTQVMEHVKKPWIMAQQIARILKPGGTCIVSAPFITPYHAHPNDFFRYTEAGMRSLLEGAGLEIILCTKHGGWWACVGETVKQKYFSPYDKKKSWFRRRLSMVLEQLFRLLDRTTPPGIAYCNVVCVARKPL